MTSQTKYCAALFWLRTPWGAVPILPLRGVFGLVALSAFLAAAALLVDWQLQILAKKGQISSDAWVVEDRKINELNYQKISVSDDVPIFRSKGYEPPARTNGRGRILVVGDSFIWGDGHTNINMTWWRQLAWELEKRGYRKVDVIAAGVNGASTQQQLRWLKNPRFIAAAQPDVIVLGYVTNDPQMADAKGKDLVKVYVPGAVPKKADDGVLPVLRHELANRAQGQIEYNDEVGYPYTQWELKLLEGENFRRYREVLKELSATLKALGIPTFAVTTPNVPDKAYYEQRYPPVRAAFADAGIEFIDLLPPLVDCCTGAMPPLGWGINPANGHPGPKLTHFFAARVADLLEQRHPEVLGPRTSGALPLPRINDWMPAAANVRRAGDTEWTFSFPPDTGSLLRLPIDEPHLALNLERPARLKDIQLTSRGPDRFRVWAMAINPKEGHEMRDYFPVGEGTGPRLKLTLPGELAKMEITSLRIARESRSAPAGVEVVVKAAPFNIAPAGGAAYVFPAPALAGEADTMQAPRRSPYVVLENGKPLPHGHAIHDEIRNAGGGRYSHWAEQVVFSASDGSDPRRNGREYVLARLNHDDITLKMGFAEAGQP